MAKWLCLLCLSMLIWTEHAQTQNLQGGIFLGFNGSQVDGDANTGFRKVGAVLGGYVRYPLQEGGKLAFRPELLYEQLGSRDKTQLIVATGHFSFPLLMEWRVPIVLGENEQEFQIHAGPVVGVLLHARDLFGSRVRDLQRFDYRFTAGVAYQFSDRWSVGYRLGYSIVTFVNAGSPYATSFGIGRRMGAFHRYMQFSFHYQLD